MNSTGNLNIAQNLNKLKEKLGDEVCLVAVSKTVSVENIRKAYDAGQRHFGENKVQELLIKQSELPEDIHWHLIGHLQSNKVKSIAPFIHLIHSVDSEKLLLTIDQEAENCERVIDYLLQVHIAEEESKFGLSIALAASLAARAAEGEFKHSRCRGLMGMATFTDDTEKVRSEFNRLRHLFVDLSEISRQQVFDTLSMGMSGDHEIAVKCGSNMVRVGSLIFGGR